jgi:Cu+-exporting ATPase
VKGVIDAKRVALGNAKLVDDLGLDGGKLSETANARRDEGETVMFVIVGSEIAGLVSVADPVKETTPAALKALHDQGFRIVMATGDNARTAKAVAAKLGIDEIRADVLPEDKARIIKEMQTEGRKVAMAGDGVNDAPALAVWLARPCATSNRTCSSPWSTTPQVCRWRRASSTRSLAS